MKTKIMLAFVIPFGIAFGITTSVWRENERNEEKRQRNENEKTLAEKRDRALKMFLSECSNITNRLHEREISFYKNLAEIDKEILSDIPSLAGHDEMVQELRCGLINMLKGEIRECNKRIIDAEGEQVDYFIWFKWRDVFGEWHDPF